MEFFWIGLGIAGFCTITGFAYFRYKASSRNSYESAPYTVVSKSGQFEVRDYPTLTIVEGSMASRDNTFMKLFRFITGRNEKNQQIAMTTPVFMTNEQQEEKMCFVMPATMKTEDVPKPNDTSLNVREMQAAQFATYTYSGRMTKHNEQEALQQLKDWLQKEQKSYEGSPIYAYFDGPFTLPWFKRNEVMLKLVQRLM